MIYHVFANRSNIGDWLSAKGIQKLLAPAEVTECLCDEPFVSETLELLSQASENDLIVIGGGGLLMDYFVPFWQGFDQVSRRIPFCIWGVGCCDLTDEFSLPPANLIRAITDRSLLCVVRDELTSTFLDGAGKPSIIGCPSLNVIESASSGDNVLHVTNYSTVGAKAYEVMRSTAMDLAQRTGRSFSETNNLISKGSEAELGKQIERYANSDAVISSALHGCIIGLAVGAKVLAVSGDRKIEGFMESVGLKEWVLRNDDLGDLTALMNRLDCQPDVSIALEDIRTRNREVSFKVAASMAS